MKILVYTVLSLILFACSDLSQNTDKTELKYIFSMKNDSRHSVKLIYKTKTEYGGKADTTDRILPDSTLVFCSATSTNQNLGPFDFLSYIRTLKISNDTLIEVFKDTSMESTMWSMDTKTRSNTCYWNYRPSLPPELPFVP